MIDVITSFNTTTFPYKSIIIGGSSQAPTPEANETMSVLANTEIIKYLREKNPMQGIYWVPGPTDFTPLNFQDFTSANNAFLTTIGTALNPNAGSYSSYTSISHDTDQLTEYAKWGSYTVDDFVYNILQTDVDNADWGTVQIANGGLNVIFLNTMVCHNKNMALMRETDDPGS